MTSFMNNNTITVSTEEPYIHFGSDVEKIIQYSDGTVEVRSTRSYFRRDLSAVGLSPSFKLPMAFMFTETSALLWDDKINNKRMEINLRDEVLAEAKRQNLKIETAEAIPAESYTTHGERENLVDNPTPDVLDWRGGANPIDFEFKSEDIKIHGKSTGYSEYFDG